MYNYKQLEKSQSDLNITARTPLIKREEPRSKLIAFDETVQPTIMRKISPITQTRANNQPNLLEEEDDESPKTKLRMSYNEHLRRTLENKTRGQASQLR